MNFFNPKNLKELHSIADKIDGKYYYLAGGTDINVQIKHEIESVDYNPPEVLICKKLYEVVKPYPVKNE